MPQAVRRMAATAEVQHCFREVCMRYVGVARDGVGDHLDSGRVSQGGWQEPSCIWLLTLSREESISQSGLTLWWLL